MWAIREAKSIAKVLAKADEHIADKYEFWKSIVRVSGPTALRSLRGMNDEASSGAWKGFRSSRLNEQWRVIYRIESTEVTVYVERVSVHGYRR